VFGRLSDAQVLLVGEGEARSDTGLWLRPDVGFAVAPQLDVVCVPGGPGVNAAMEDEATLSFIRAQAERAAWITSVCTGALVLGAAGLLRGYRATTHWLSLDLLSAFGATPVRDRVVVDRNRVTGGGVTAGIDFGLRLAAELRGERFAARDTALRGPAPWLGRVALAADVERPFGRQRLVLRTTAAAVRARPVVPPQDLVYLGGPTSAPGYAYHEFAGRLGASQRVEWRLPVPFVSVPLGRFGRVPQSATLAPFVHAVYVRHPDAARPSREGLYSAAGAGLLTLFDALRFDVARGLRDGRWTFSVDVAREFWSVL
jgi:putative intracellular protease/amidase